MQVVLRMVLTAQGMISSSVVGSEIRTNSRIECSHQCFQNTACSAFFYDDFNNRCFLYDELQNVTAMGPAHANMKYYEAHSDHCNNGYTYKRGMNLCYKVFSTRISWFSARSNCLTDGAHLIRVKSAVVNNLMFQEAIIAGRSLWTDGRRNGTQLTWQDGHIVQKTFWTPYQPDGSSTDCVAINFNENVASSSWHDLRCDYQLPYICQKDLDFPGC